MGILPLPCQTKISHMKRKIIKKPLYRQKINLKGHWESRSQVQMETVHCHSSFTSHLLMGVLICEKVLPQSAVSFVKFGFSVWVFFYIIRTFGCQVLTNIITSLKTDIRKKTARRLLSGSHVFSMGIDPLCLMASFSFFLWNWWTLK